MRHKCVPVLQFIYISKWEVIFCIVLVIVVIQTSAKVSAKNLLVFVFLCTFLLAAMEVYLCSAIVFISNVIFYAVVTCEIKHRNYFKIILFYM